MDHYEHWTVRLEEGLSEAAAARRRRNDLRCRIGIACRRIDAELAAAEIKAANAAGDVLLMGRSEAVEWRQTPAGFGRVLGMR